MLIVYYELMINAVAFAAYGIDKYRAQKNRYRIPEATLIGLAVIGGALGALFGMKIFHHKTLKPKFLAVPILLGIQILLAGFCLYSNLHIVVTNYEYRDENYTGDGLRIVQISDLHNQFFGIKQEYLLGKIRALGPDIIAVTGDVVDSRHTNYYLALQFFKGASEIAPVYYVKGNHELLLKSDERDRFFKELDELGVIRQWGVTETMGIRLIGLDDDQTEDDTLSKYTDGESGMTEILLSHKPEYYNKYKESGVGLVLVGHMHGGQIIIPGMGGLLSPDVEFFPEFYEGMHKIGNTEMIISRGLGNSVIPLRINDQPEIVTVDIKKK